MDAPTFMPCAVVNAGFQLATATGAPPESKTAMTPYCCHVYVCPVELSAVVSGVPPIVVSICDSVIDSVSGPNLRPGTAMVSWILGTLLGWELGREGMMRLAVWGGATGASVLSSDSTRASGTIYAKFGFRFDDRSVMPITRPPRVVTGPPLNPGCTAPSS